MDGVVAPDGRTRSRRAVIAALGAGLATPAWALAEPPAEVAPKPGETEDLLQGRKDWTSRLTTPVSIDGKGPFRFIIDTGANRSVISSQVAAALALPPGKPTLVHDIVGAREAQTVNVKSFTAGGIAIPIHDIPVLAGADLGAQGLLGIDAFRNRRVTFDFAREEVRITRSANRTFDAPPRGRSITTETTVRAEQRSGQLTIIDAQAVDRRITCFIDSGAQDSIGNLAMRRLVQARVGGADVPVVLRGATGEDAPGVVAAVPSMRIGRLKFNAVSMIFADLHTFALWRLADRPAMMIGMDLLSSFDMVSIDFGEKAVTFRTAVGFGPAVA